MLLAAWEGSGDVGCVVMAIWFPLRYGTPLAQQVDKLKEYHATHLLESIRLH